MAYNCNSNCCGSVIAYSGVGYSISNSASSNNSEGHHDGTYYASSIVSNYIQTLKSPALYSPLESAVSIIDSAYTGNNSSVGHLNGFVIHSGDSRINVNSSMATGDLKGIDLTSNNANVAHIANSLYNLPYNRSYNIGNISDILRSGVTYTPNPFFLNPLRPKTRFIDSIDIEVRQIVEKTFEAVFNQEFPDDIVINILNKDNLRKAHLANGGVWNNSILGFAINRRSSIYNNEVSEVFVLNDELDSLIITIGHELGHIVSPTLKSRHDEEAKAFAFQHLWVNTIIENNIGNLHNSFVTTHNPAANGLHDVAFLFVQSLLRSGMSARHIFYGLTTKELSIGG